MGTTTNTGDILLQRIADLLNVTIQEVEIKASYRIKHIVINPITAKCLMQAEGVLTVDNNPNHKIIKEKEIACTFQIKGQLFSVDIIVSNTCSGNNGIEIVLFD